MTHAELLRSHANLAIKEGGMYYSGEYLSRVAAAAESLEAENARLRELLAIASDMARDYDGDRRLLRRLVQELYEDQCDECDQWKYRDRMRVLGVEVP